MARTTTDYRAPSGRRLYAADPGEELFNAPSARTRRRWKAIGYVPSPAEVAAVFAKDPDVQRLRRRNAWRGQA